MEDALKFTWAYMIQDGKLTNGTWSYYSGDFEAAYGNDYDYAKANMAMDAFRTKVKTVGIDWAKTSTPESSMESCFEGTFNESTNVETLLGTIILNDGSEYTVGVGNSEKRFSGYMKMLNSLMEDRQRVKDLLGE